VLGQGSGQVSVQQSGQQLARESEPSVGCCPQAAVLVHWLLVAMPHSKHWKQLQVPLAVSQPPVASILHLVILERWLVLEGLFCSP